MKKKLQLHYADPFSFEKADINPRIHTPEQISSLQKSIKKFGFLVPVLVDKKKKLIAGHARVLAAQELQLESIPYLEVSNLSEKEKKAFLLLENRLHEKSSWDWELFSQEMRILQDDFDLQEIGFDRDDFSTILKNENLETENFEEDSEEDQNSKEKEKNEYALDEYCLIVTLQSEAQQKKVFQRLLSEGLEVRFA